MTTPPRDDAKHTPGPWALVPQSDGSSMVVLMRETGDQMKPKAFRLIAHVMARGNSLAEDEANATRIVQCVNAHDELVEALRPFANYACEPPCNCHNCRARAAIAKATGRNQ